MCLSCGFLEDARQTAFIAVRRVQRRTAKTSLGYFFEHSTRQPVGKGKKGGLCRAPWAKTHGK
jgi:hypothetical protein